jgi:hypothetical protein
MDRDAVLVLQDAGDSVILKPLATIQPHKFNGKCTADYFAITIL